MNLTAYQILAPLISIIAILYVWSLAFRQRKTIWEASIWTIVWCFISAIAIFPDLISYLTKITGIQNRENAVFVTSIGILFSIVFYLVIRIEELDRRYARMVRKIALKDVEQEEKK